MMISSTHRVKLQARHLYWYQVLGSLNGNPRGLLSGLKLSFIGYILEYFIFFYSTVFRMIKKFQNHRILTLGAAKWIFFKGVPETLLKWFGRQDVVSSGFNRQGFLSRLLQLRACSLVSRITVEPIMPDPLESFGQYGLDHSSDEGQHRKAVVLDLSGFVVAIPEADGFSIISFDSSDRDRGRDQVFGQILCQPFSFGRDISFFYKSDKAFGEIFPCSVDVSLDMRIVRNLFFEHSQQMILPFSMEQVIRDKFNAMPCSLRRESTGGEKNMKMRVVIGSSTSQLKNDDGSDIEALLGECFNSIDQTGVSRFHDFGKEMWISEEVWPEEIGSRQDVVSVCNIGQEPSADEVSPCIGISFGTGQAEAGFTGECNAFIFSALATAELGESHFIGVSTVEHFLNNGVVVFGVEFWVESGEWFPMIPKYLLKCIIVNTFHGLAVYASHVRMIC